MVIKNNNFYGELVQGHCGQLKQGHLEASVSRDGDDGLIRAGKGGANGGREAEAHRAGTTGG